MIYYINEIIGIYLSNPIGQSIGLLAFCMSLYTFLHREDNIFYKLLIITFSIWTIHFIYMGLYMGALINFINIFRTLAALKYKKNKYIMFGLIGVYTLIGIYNFNNIINIIPILTGIIGVFAFISFKGIQGRILLLINSFLWLTYGVIGHSIGNIVTEIFMILIGIYTIYKMYKERGK